MAISFRSGHGVDDRHSLFMISIGELCDAAKLGGFQVEVLTTADAQIAGIPSPVLDQSEHQVDETGYARTFRLDSALVNLDHIRTLTIHAPVDGQ